jgi:hypothetical protein
VNTVLQEAVEQKVEETKSKQIRPGPPRLESSQEGLGWGLTRCCCSCCASICCSTTVRGPTVAPGCGASHSHAVNFAASSRFHVNGPMGHQHSRGWAMGPLTQGRASSGRQWLHTAVAAGYRLAGLTRVNIMHPSHWPMPPLTTPALPTCRTGRGPASGGAHAGRVAGAGDAGRGREGRERHVVAVGRDAVREQVAEAGRVAQHVPRQAVAREVGLQAAVALLGVAPAGHVGVEVVGPLANRLRDGPRVEPLLPSTRPLVTSRPPSPGPGADPPASKYEPPPARPHEETRSSWGLLLLLRRRPHGPTPRAG